MRSRPLRGLSAAGTSLAAVLFAFTPGCASSDGPITGTATCAGDCLCSGGACSCKTGGTCTFGIEPANTGGDRGADGAFVAVGSPPSGVAYHCDAKGQCNLTCGTGCTSTCDGKSTCSGSCAADCTSSCAGTSQCTLATGTNSDVTCAGGSACAITLGAGSTLSCTGNSDCTIRCPSGGCTAKCEGSASCMVECGPSAACPVECNGGTADACPAASTCTGVCSKSGGSVTPNGDAGARDAATAIH